VEDLLVSLSIETSTLPDGVLRIVLRGEIDVDTAHEVRDVFATALTQGRPTRIELNLRRVSFIDSVGISALVAGFQTAEVSGVRLVVVEPSRFVHRQLWVTGLLGLFGAPEPYLGDVDATPEAGVR
jgi:anti-sigma B factor antagonist